ncbi:MAG: hypothetical protein A2268_11980 [Candidatus Raymondbacteria bacterium RifOxyA12_full_50_37]|uniref:DUF86 domain-containing protein n=1 Tax=Candidatus Raymondbacteria bacterium RIFOXYD12_FULL_49_13 TaxID=1817890 RepID=A0A1F7FGH3_UNCRA|nr:MAG: hypothetical protein A2268_11980 [Candidatus Raymondbacteria bacterium RifOxyA12_full_50_37]OGJ91698.1 MAG: hypothetical protein A2248_08045 [Candidatus Raymondbacteria bacterium RIFOXYA2_FULL_49_16]OGJ98709.1 MAG: hypothetical protein A2453_08210 [Candidatus Raymondbacteria bacterium RIFOXYC2_FULL_50_21]OGK01517.1 MAG: hypothetical protein A2487_13365 [Candidatus Raymondbacteria bacterium RifOxyC12_full_50_8]OGK05794.1 MAG: hypothetical protein A2519_01755 [Candidatus Raymondbacteria b
MKKDDSVYIQHMLDAIKRVEEYIGGTDNSGFCGNKMLQAAVCREIEIIGEASKHLSRGFKAKHPDIPWKAIAGMRDKLIHDYFGIDYNAVWDTAIKDIPFLRSLLLKPV